MSPRRFLPVLAAAAVLAPPAGSAAPAHSSGAAQGCTALIRLDLPGVEIAAADPIAPGPFAAPDGQRLSVPAFCRVHGVARPTPASEIRFEVWLPAAWDGRYVQQGNGGFAGNLSYPTLADEVRRGHAVAVTDTGHTGDGFDASWAWGQPQKVIDYGYRAIKATSDVAHALIGAYYGRPAAHRYYVGCSNGGRQALMAAELYPDDWDGVIAGAPAVRWTEQLATFARLQQRLRGDPATWIPADKLPAIESAALRSCAGAAASVENGAPRDPRACRFDPATLRCIGADHADCLTPAQVETVRQIQAAGYSASAAAAQDGWAQWILNPDVHANSTLTFATQAFRYLAGKGAAWDARDFDALRDPGALAATPVAGRSLHEVLDPDSRRLDAFAARGGKLISYIGWADPVLSPEAGLAYHREVVARRGAASTDAFYRLFMIPGMGHCQGGAGPAAFGQSIPAPAAAGDPRHDIRRALEAWVEQGEAPEEIVAVAYRGGDPAQGVAAQRIISRQR